MARAKAIIAILLLGVGESRAECIILATTLGVENIIVLDQTDLSRVFSIPGPARPFGFVVRGNRAWINRTIPSSGGEHLSDPGKITEFDLVARAVAVEYPTGRTNIDLAYARGKLYTSNSEDETVTVVDLASGETATLPGFATFPSALAASPDESRVYVADGTYGTIYVVDTALDQIVDSFPGERAAESLLATDELVFVSGSGAGTTGGLLVFSSESDTYPLQWMADLGFSRSFAITSSRLFSVSRRTFQSVSLQAPHGTLHHVAGSGTAPLWSARAVGDTVYLAGDEGLFRFTAGNVRPVLIYAGPVRDVAVARCPGTELTFAGDADCDSEIGEADIAATVRGVYDRASRLRCEADCNSDGRVTSADVPCTIRAFSADGGT